MRCPSCGAISKKRSMKCAECGAFRNRTWVDTESTGSRSGDGLVQTRVLSNPKRKRRPKSSPSLLEFPNPTRQAIPEWRKELGDRVREVQERRAREASLEDGQTSPQALPDAEKGLRPLELLSKPSIPPTNPLVLAALRRIERAHAPSQFSGNTAIATAALYEEEPAFDLKLGHAPGETVTLRADEPGTIEEPGENKVVTPGEKTHRLSVVSAALIAVPAEPAVTADPLETLEEDSNTTVKPKRLIRDNDPALNYLDSISTTVKLDLEETRSAPVFFRMCSALLDLLVVCLLSAPVVAVVKLAELQWQDPRVIALAAGTVVVAAFLYLTISTALTGRTFAMRLFSLRVVDARTGMIPTGTQSAGRALFYMFSLATAGIGLMFMFVDREKRTAHDRLTRTAVVRV